MDKVGLLTFHRTTNFGSSLQTYGLYKAIEKEGYAPEIIDYRCPAIERREAISQKWEGGIKGVAKEILLMPAIRKKAKNLEQFTESHMNKSVVYMPETIKEADGKYKKYMIGSDIVWGRDITEDDYAFFLDFVSDSTKKYAFSASSGGYEIREDETRLRRCLRDFAQIAVREEAAVDWVKQLSGKDADWVCDPTMLLTAEEWKGLFNLEQHYRDYVLVYFNDDSGKCIRDAIAYAKKYRKKVLMINYVLPVKGTKTVRPTTLDEFISLIYHADAVFTASYHGMLFSIYFNKLLYFYSRAHSSRMFSLAKKLGIMARYGGDLCEINDALFDYFEINAKVKAFQEYSINILKGMLDS